MSQNNRIGKVAKSDFQNKKLLQKLIADSVLSTDRQNDNYVCFNSGLKKEWQVVNAVKHLEPEERNFIIDAWRKSQRTRSVLREYVEAFVIAICLAMIIRTFVVQAFKIPSGSMLQTLQIGDHILVNKFIFYFTEPKRGDIIVFKYPLDPDRDFIKRVIGLPGETLEIKNQVVYINSQPIKESYIIHELPILDKEHFIPPRDNFGPLTIPAGNYFMMGDNRDSSMDSRYWGPLNSDMIKGKAFVIYWSIEPDFMCETNAPMTSKLVSYVGTMGSRIRWNRFGELIR